MPNISLLRGRFTLFLPSPFLYYALLTECDGHTTHIYILKAYCLGGSKCHALPLYEVKLTKVRAIFILPRMWLGQYSHIALTTSWVVQDQQNNHCKVPIQLRNHSKVYRLQLKVDITNNLIKFFFHRSIHCWLIHVDINIHRTMLPKRAGI